MGSGALCANPQKAVFASAKTVTVRKKILLSERITRIAVKGNADYRDRTDDLFLTMEVLYQLS